METERRNTLLALPGEGEPFDRHVLACALERALEEIERSTAPSLNASLGLPADLLSELLEHSFPDFSSVAPHIRWDHDPGEGAIEEADLRGLLLENRRHDTREGLWLAYIVARRALQPGHLWHSLGLDERTQLSTMLQRHFPTLAEQNTNNMRWKKFFYRWLCTQEGILICKSPICGDCPDYRECFILEGPDGDEH
ncbi:nitrogen fixation protein NifQ [Halorhodospira abdelmalekii]|uniref:nitrogen fixation protein NifQ n=1 Tax=Halorhodospira abdelmalekii TaxID=421629 RepID=UPI0019084380|nr:nitrogen fixation protein NifQ [Halorhodospira abdelmalekii]